MFNLSDTVCQKGNIVLILYRKYGNHSNRLLQASAFEGFCKYHNIKFYNFDFKDMAHIYGLGKKQYFKIKLPRQILPPNPVRIKIFTMLRYIYDKTLNHILKKYIAIINYYDHSSNETLDLIVKNKIPIIFAGGWMNYNAFSYYIKKYKEYFQKKYSVKTDLTNECSKILERFHNYDIVVGVHIRRGDYKEWLGGKYYYEDSVFIKYMNDFSSLNKNKKILFVIFSNEEISFRMEHEYIISKCHWYEDQHIMSKCNYLIGTPSTFTGWASFMGDVPLYHINNAGKELSMEAFNIFLDEDASQFTAFLSGI